MYIPPSTGWQSCCYQPQNNVSCPHCCFHLPWRSQRKNVGQNWHLYQCWNVPSGSSSQDQSYHPCCQHQLGGRRGNFQSVWNISPWKLVEASLCLSLEVCNIVCPPSRELCWTGTSSFPLHSISFLCHWSTSISEIDQKKSIPLFPSRHNNNIHSQHTWCLMQLFEPNSLVNTGSNKVTNN